MRLSALVLLAVAGPAAAADGVAPTGPLSPAAEKATFTLPPGFEAQLVAGEPDIGKPIQIAFDAKGRLWVTTSRHYPFAADGPPTDKLSVLSEFGPDGKAGKVETFAADLNIPIGVLPLPDCKSCLVSHVGSILKLSDTDGDGKADAREVILTGFGTKDTHGMMNSFTLLPDGWVYACHGFANESVVKAKDGSEVRMQSGNTFRFRPDGSRVEPWTYGQVNPFGMTADPWLNLYTADCHSKPITQLIRGAYYSSFGKPDDGLGLAPHVTRHDHGSTGLCGLAWYDADHFPAEYRGCLFLGNVVTSRINLDRVEWKGSTPVAKELPDFLTSTDPWFRPTDIKLGPDGALYFADFYNKIIGHYEVDLKHPGRDKDRGRVWRVVYKGPDGKAKPPAMPDVVAAPDWQLYHELAGDRCLTVRQAAVHELVRRAVRTGSLDISPYSGPGPARSESTDAAHLWRTEAAAPRFGPKLAGPVPGHKAPILTIRVLAARAEWDAGTRQAVLSLLTPDPITVDQFYRWSGVRAAVDALIAHPHPDNVAPLVKLLQGCPADDTHLRHAARIALRNALRDAPGAWAEAAKADPAVIADVAIGVPSKEAAGFLLAQVRAGKLDPRFCERVGRYGDDGQAAGVVAALTPDQPAAVFALQALHRGTQARGARLPAGAGPVAEAVCGRALERSDITAVQAAADLAAGLRLTALFDPLVAVAGRADRSDAQRAAAFAALLALDPAKAVPLVGRAVADPAAPPGLRDKAAQALAGSGQPAAREALAAALPTAPARLAGAIAAGLAGSPQGAAALLDAVQQGKASARLLQEKAVASKLLAAGGKFTERVEELTKGLPSADARVAALIRTRAAEFRGTPADPKRGQAVFTQHCAACHQVGGQGAKIGPQLDGVGVRGVDRLCEDILDPHRNVDAAFRATVLTLADGRTVTGLLVREEGPVLVLADPAGKEVRVAGGDVEKRAVSPLSPMPANFDAAVPEADFPHLLAYLLEQRAKDVPRR